MNYWCCQSAANITSPWPLVHTGRVGSKYKQLGSVQLKLSLTSRLVSSLHFYRHTSAFCYPQHRLVSIDDMIMLPASKTLIKETDTLKYEKNISSPRPRWTGAITAVSHSALYNGTWYHDIIQGSAAGRSGVRRYWPHSLFWSHAHTAASAQSEVSSLRPRRCKETSVRVWGDTCLPATFCTYKLIRPERCTHPMMHCCNARPSQSPFPAMHLHHAAWTHTVIKCQMFD